MSVAPTKSWGNFSATVRETDGSQRPLDHYDAPALVGHREQRHFHVMVKPSGATCNLDCAYCFYLSKEVLPNGPGAGRISDETLDRLTQTTRTTWSTRRMPSEPQWGGSKPASFVNGAGHSAPGGPRIHDRTNHH